MGQGVRSGAASKAQQGGPVKERRESKQRGVFEKVPGSGIWWIRYFDQFGKKRREKAVRRAFD